LTVGNSTGANWKNRDWGKFSELEKGIKSERAGPWFEEWRG